MFGIHWLPLSKDEKIFITIVVVVIMGIYVFFDKVV
jgi:hypothetical protein